MATTTVSSFTWLSSSHSITPSSTSTRNNALPPPSSVSFRRIGVTASVCTASEPTVRSSTSTLPSSFYDVLGVQAGASCKEIKAAYRRLAREVHPDVNGGQRDRSADEFIKVREAYATLSDPQKRADYDRALFLRGRIVYGSMPSASSMRPVNQSGSRAAGRRTWETDQCW